MMALLLIYVGGPILFFFLLRALPRGVLSDLAFIAAGLLLAALWATYALELEPFTGDGRRDVYGLFALVFWTLAVALAAFFRGSRAARRSRRKAGRWLVLLLVLLIALPLAALMLV